MRFRCFGGIRKKCSSKSEPIYGVQKLDSRSSSAIEFGKLMAQLSDGTFAIVKLSPELPWQINSYCYSSA